MSKWNNEAEWQALTSGEACPICQRGYALDIIQELEASWLTMFEKQATMRGYVCLVAKRHVVELHEFTDSEAAEFMRDMRKVSSAVCAATNCVKLNIEIHGNTLPHLHVHFFPRYKGDQFEGGAIEPKKVVQPVYREGEFESVRDAIIQFLSR
ncbi:MAG: HIT family protein [Candidatus Kapaibacteriota bacterium]